MKRHKIKFSIIISLYNKEQYIFQTLQSVINQTYNNFEVIIINDGSTDNSTNIVNSVNDNRIKLVNQKNIGVAAARNKGIEFSNNNWLVMLDADDLLDANYLNECSKAIQKNQDAICYVSNYIKLIRNKSYHNANLKFIPKYDGVIDNYFKASFFNRSVIITSSSVCINKHKLGIKKMLKLFPEGIKRGEDLDAWLRLALNGEIYYINKQLVIINDNIDSVSNSKYDIEQSFNYFKWLHYKTEAWGDKFYIVLLTFKRQFKILIKLVRFKRFKDIPKLMCRIIERY